MGHALAFDTLTFASNLQDAGMDEKQAKALATGLYNSQDRIIENLATKIDVEKLDSKIDMVKQELESKIDKLDAKFDSKIDLVRKDMETSNNLIRKDMESNHQHVKWMVGTTLAAVIAILIRSFF
ncbi:MAG: hypothetical protein GY755_01230 [Chloroflexi bacterium]|nr:hypothetical protein [Chloroflexota bacterium]